MIYTVKLGDGTQYDYHINGKDNSFVERLKDGQHVVNVKILSQDYDKVVRALEKEGVK